MVFEQIYYFSCSVGLWPLQWCVSLKYDIKNDGPDFFRRILMYWVRICCDLFKKKILSSQTDLYFFVIPLFLFTSTSLCVAEERYENIQQLLFSESYWHQLLFKKLTSYFMKQIALNIYYRIRPINIDDKVPQMLLLLMSILYVNACYLMMSLIANYPLSFNVIY